MLLNNLKINLPDKASYFLVALILFVILFQDLLAALYAGLLVYAIVHLLALQIGDRISGQGKRIIAVTVLGSTIILGLSFGIWAILSFFLSDAGSLPVLLKKMADLIDQSRSEIPDWLNKYIPQGAEALQQTLTNWIRENASHAQQIGKLTGRFIVQIIIGMIIGAMIALFENKNLNLKPFSKALTQRALNLHISFRQIVFAQVRIAAINAFFTGIFLAFILPLMNVNLPFIKTMILITFITGLLPVIGNLISNTVIVVIALSHSLFIAILCLVFLIAIHKFEYFLNAKIIGNRINSRAWELLVSMLLMESIFGIAGVIAAPVYYAYFKSELQKVDLI